MTYNQNPKKNDLLFYTKVDKFDMKMIKVENIIRNQNMIRF